VIVILRKAPHGPFRMAGYQGADRRIFSPNLELGCRASTPADPPMEIDLTPALERYVHDKVESGEYRSAEDVIQTALGLLHREQQTAELRDAIEEGIADFEGGRSEPMDEVFAELRAERAARLDALRRELDPATAEFERGESIPGPIAIEQAKAEFRRLTGREAD
jgi:antitoxin ParD1/3/4